MVFFIDTADLGLIKKWAPLPFVKGVTTNPLVLQASNVKDRFPHLQQIQSLLRPDQELMIQAIGETPEKLLEDALLIHAAFPRAVVKIPTVWEGLSIAPELRKKKIEICFTVVYYASQGILGALAEGKYIAPYIGRMRQNQIDPWKEIEQMRDAIREFDLPTHILAASLRSQEDISNAFALGCDITAKPSVWDECLTQPLVLKSLDDFNRAHVP